LSRWLLYSLLLSCAGCSSQRPSCDVSPSASEPTLTLQLMNRFERDAAFRSDCLKWSLVNPNNGYSKARFAHYDTDWARLPVLGFRTRPVMPGDLGKPAPTPDATWSAPASGEPIDSMQQLRRRGEEMFRRFPAQVEPSLLPILRDAHGPSRYGLWETPDSVGGLVWVALPGGVFPSLTCSSCHASLDAEGRLRLGNPNHAIDLGRARDDHRNAKSLFSTWGPGRVDIAADEQDTPIAIPDVRAVRFQHFLHRTANIRNSLTALALRVETGLVVAHFRAVRPERRDAFALAYFLWTLGEGFDLQSPQRHPGRAAFERHCAKCHTGQGHSGRPVTPESLQSPVAKMPSAARGTGQLQVPALLGVAQRRLLLFGGEAKGIDSLLDPSRRTGGHYVDGIDPVELQAIRTYLEAL